MIILRGVKDDDIESLEKLSRLAAERHPGFLNVPQDPEGWSEKIAYSQASFNGKLPKGHIKKFMFVAEDSESKAILGMSMISSQHGTKDSPHFYFEVDSEQKFSQTINTGFIHGTLRLKIDHDGPTEIGGLLVNPEIRNHEGRVGRQISFVRFLYLAMNRSYFKNKIIAELLPPLTKKGKSPLWEAVGRRFTNMDYWEADYLSSKNKEFILSLFPSGTIYVTFLPAEARNAIGKVSKDTEPVMHMLKKIGFKYLNQVDPFDGGPHLLADTDEINPVKNTKEYVYKGEYSAGQASAGELVQGLVTASNRPDFIAIAADVMLGSNQEIYFSNQIASALDLSLDAQVFFMPYY